MKFQERVSFCCDGCDCNLCSVAMPFLHNVTVAVQKNANLYTFDPLSCIVLTDMASFESCWPNWQFYHFFYPVSFLSDATQISRQQKYESDEKSWCDPISSICRVWVSSVEWIQGVSKYLRRLSSLMNMALLFLPTGGGRTHSSSEVSTWPSSEQGLRFINVTNLSVRPPLIQQILNFIKTSSRVLIKYWNCIDTHICI